MLELKKLLNLIDKGGGYYSARCPACLHNNEGLNENHLGILPDGKFNCVKYSSNKDHNKLILQLIGSDSDVIYIPPEPKIKSEQIYPDNILNRLIRSFDYWNNRGISTSTIEQYEGGVATAGKLYNRYVFALRDQSNRLHGFTGRYIHPIPPPRRLEDGTWIEIERWKHSGEKKNWIFNRKNIREYVYKNNVIVLTEGIGCVLALREIDMCEVLPIFGIVPSSKVLSFLVSLNPAKIIVSLNNESSEIGNEASDRTIGILSNFFNPDKLCIRLPPKKDWLASSIDERLSFKKEIYGF